MSSSNLRTDSYKSVTGTDLGSKHAVDVAVIGSVSISGTINASSTPTFYATLLDESTSLVTYVGKADPGTATSSAGWQITRLVSSSTLLITTYADGNSSFDNIWDNRASLSYS